MSNEILNAIQAKLKSLEYELKIWDDEFEGGGQLAKRELTGKVEAYREIVGMIGNLPLDAREKGEKDSTELDDLIWQEVHRWCNGQSSEIPDQNRRALMDLVRAIVLGSDGLVCPKKFASWCEENYSIEIPERVVMEYERYYNAVWRSEQLLAFRCLNCNQPLDTRLTNACQCTASVKRF